MINELELIENIDILFESKLILYGAGQVGKKTYIQLREAGIEVSYFCDSESSKWGMVHDGIEVIPPEKLRELDSQGDIVIIIASRASIAIQIMDTIEKLDLRTSNILTLFGLEILFVQNANSLRINSRYRDFLFASEKWKKELAILREKDLQIVRHTEYPLETNDILIYSSHKVGSMSVLDSLIDIGLTHTKIHYLVDHPFVSGLKEIYKTSLGKIKKLDKIKIITLVREPLAREYSLFFQYLGTNSAYFYMSNGDSLIESCVKSMQSSVFGSIEIRPSYGLQFDWFDHELKAAFDIDIFQYPFDKDLGYSIIKDGNVEILVMKLEKLNTLESIIADFVGAPHFKLINSNEGSNKIYKHLYKNVREVIKIPREVIDLYYKDNSRMSHFYTEEEKVGFLKKWENNIAELLG